MCIVCVPTESLSVTLFMGVFVLRPQLTDTIGKGLPEERGLDENDQKEFTKESQEQMNSRQRKE